MNQTKTTPALVYGMCWLVPDQEKNCHECHTMSCPVNTGHATYDMLFDNCNKEQSEAGERNETAAPVHGMCWLVPDQEKNCHECHTRSCPVNTGFATYEMLFDKK